MHILFKYNNLQLFHEKKNCSSNLIYTDIGIYSYSIEKNSKVNI